MRVFEVVTEYAKENDEMERTRQYVTTENNALKTVAEYFTAHCYQYEKDLISVAEILTITQHIE